MRFNIYEILHSILSTGNKLTLSLFYFLLNSNIRLIETEYLCVAQYTIEKKVTREKMRNRGGAREQKISFSAK